MTAWGTSRNNGSATGDGATGGALVDHDDIDKIAFTGSTEVGKIIQRSIAGKGKRCTLELGGKAANVVFADAPLDQAIEGIVQGIYFNQGHVCCAGSRLLVEESVHDEVVERLTNRLHTLRLGDPLDKNTDIGAINSREQLERIQELVQSGIEQGATLVQAECELPARGFYFPASFFTNVHPSHRIAREEIFGPVLAIMTFRTPEEAIDKANNTPYGLSGYVFGRTVADARRVAARLRTGMVHLNGARVDVAAPFGGPTSSGMLTLHCPPKHVHALASFLREHGAEAVSVAALDYVYSRDTPLYARLTAELDRSAPRGSS